MPEPKLYKTIKEIGFKFLSLLVSMKYHVWAVATIAMFTGFLASWLWVAFSAAILGIRGWQTFMLTKPNNEVPVEEPEVD